MTDNIPNTPPPLSSPLWFDEVPAYQPGDSTLLANLPPMSVFFHPVLGRVGIRASDQVAAFDTFEGTAMNTYGDESVIYLGMLRTTPPLAEDKMADIPTHTSKETDDG